MTSDHPEYSQERADEIAAFSERLFGRSWPVRATREDAEEMFRMSNSLYSNPKTNERDKTLDATLLDTSRGMMVERACADAFDIRGHRIKRSIDLKDPNDYAFDLKIMGRSVEVKSITKGFERHLNASYADTSLGTFKRNQDKIDYVVFGYPWKDKENGIWMVDFVWVISARFFTGPYLMDSMQSIGGRNVLYKRFSPTARPILRRPDACRWNEKIVEMEHPT